MPVEILTDTGVVNMGTRVIKYPDPFFDIANNYLPKNIKTLFKFCRNFFHTNAFLRNVITKLTEYPITDILYDTNLDEETKTSYNTLLHDKLKVKSTLIEIGLDYFTMGNVFLSIMLLPKRFLRCSACNELHTIESVEYNFKNYEFFAKKCPACGAENVFMEAKDEPIKTIENIRLVRWAPENIDIDYNPITGSSTYYYTIPGKTKAQILAGNKTILKDIPLVFLQSLKLNKKIELNKDNLYHMKYPTLAEEDMGWGKPMILPAMKDIYYLQTLRRGNEAIANEHIVPKKAIYPASGGAVDPYSQMNLGRWKGEINTQIERWKIDANHIAVFPIPIGYQELGGNAKMLMLTPEMKFLEENIINSMGVPLEFIKGGASWTGSSVSLRIVENHFLTYRELLLDFMNYFLIPKLGAFLKYPKIKVHFKKFKMSDDSESKQLILQLNQEGKVSDKTLHDEFGFDHHEEVESLRKSRAAERDEAIIGAEKQAEAQGHGQVILAKYQARAEQAMADERFRLKAELFETELMNENQAIPEDPYILINKYALEILNLPEPLQAQKLQQLAMAMPVTYNLVIEKLHQYQMEQMGGMGGEYVPTTSQAQGVNTPPGGKAPNSKHAGERKENKVKAKGEKKVGQKTGEA